MWPAYNPSMETAEGGEDDMAVVHVDDGTAAAVTGVAAASAARAPLPATRVTVADAAACFASGAYIVFVVCVVWCGALAVVGGCLLGPAASSRTDAVVRRHHVRFAPATRPVVRPSGGRRVVVVIGSVGLGSTDSGSGGCRDLRWVVQVLSVAAHAKLRAQTRPGVHARCALVTPAGACCRREHAMTLGSTTTARR